jgi:glycerol-3-phosphate O-acyltransferase
VPTDRPLVSYDPNPLLSWLYARFFERIEVDEAWVKAVREADARGTVVYVLRSLSFVDFLALDHLTKRYSLPHIRFANDLGLWILEPMGRGWLNALRPRTPEGDAADLERAVESGASAALFLKRPPATLVGSGRGRIEGDHLLRALLDVQRRDDKHVLLVPQTFVWSRSAGQHGTSAVDAVFGPAQWPGQMRQVAQFLANFRHASLRAGEPVDLHDFLAREKDGAGDDGLVRRLTYTLLRRLERERRVIVGSVRKPADRLREEVVRSPKLQKVITDMAGQGAREREVITTRALGMLREMEAALDMNAIAALDRVFEGAASRMFSAIEVDEKGIEGLRELAKEGTIVLLPSHKSHMDYLALAWILYRHKLQLPLIAAGDNLNFFPVGPIFRRAGAFFIRRSFSGDRLYAAVVDAYIRRLIKDGVSLEFFPEGGRSRTGKVLPPKLGLLSIVVDAALGVPTRTTYFCPVSIGYERFVEEKAFVRELSGGDKEKEDVRGLVRSVETMIGRYGRLSVQFGKPLTLTDVLREIDPAATSASLQSLTPAKRRGVVTRLGFRVMNEINAVAAVTPGSLVACALLVNERRGVMRDPLQETCGRLARRLHGAGARFSPSLVDASGNLRPSALDEAVDLFVRAGHLASHVVGGDTIYVVPDEARMSLDLAKNVVIHFFAARALVATALLSPPGAPLTADVVRERVLALSRLFKHEFTFRADAKFETIFDEEVAAMQAEGELARIVRMPSEGAGALVPKGDDGAEQLRLYASLLANFLEGYRIAARGLTPLLRGPFSIKDLTKRALTDGQKMFLAGELHRREAVSRPLLENAFASFVDQGYLSRSEGKVALTPSFASAGAVAAIEARIVAMGIATS